MKKQFTEQEVFVTLQDLLKRLAGVAPEKVQMESRLVEDFGLDSLTTLELLMEAEESFDISISESDIKNLATIESLVAYLVRSANG